MASVSNSKVDDYLSSAPKGTSRAAIEGVIKENNGDQKKIEGAISAMWTQSENVESEWHDVTSKKNAKKKKDEEAAAQLSGRGRGRGGFSRGGKTRNGNGGPGAQNQQAQRNGAPKPSQDGQPAKWVKGPKVPKIDGEQETDDDNDKEKVDEVSIAAIPAPVPTSMKPNVAAPAPSGSSWANIVKKKEVKPQPPPPTPVAAAPKDEPEKIDNTEEEPKIIETIVEVEIEQEVSTKTTHSVEDIEADLFAQQDRIIEQELEVSEPELVPQVEQTKQSVFMPEGIEPILDEMIDIHGVGRVSFGVSVMSPEDMQPTLSMQSLLKNFDKELVDAGTSFKFQELLLALEKAGEEKRGLINIRDLLQSEVKELQERNRKADAKLESLENQVSEADSLKKQVTQLKQQLQAQKDQAAAQLAAQSQQNQPPAPSSSAQNQPPSTASQQYFDNRRYSNEPRGAQDDYYGSGSGNSYNYPPPHNQPPHQQAHGPGPQQVYGMPAYYNFYPPYNQFSHSPSPRGFYEAGQSQPQGPGPQQGYDYEQSSSGYGRQSPATIRGPRLRESGPSTAGQQPSGQIQGQGGPSGQSSSQGQQYRNAPAPSDSPSGGSHGMQPPPGYGGQGPHGSSGTYGQGGPSQGYGMHYMQYPPQSSYQGDQRPPHTPWGGR